MVNDLKSQKTYSIGEASKKCNISTKALRYYDQNGILQPDKVCDNKYRYYSAETLLTIPIVNYYKQMGFTLSEMRGYINGSNLGDMRRLFRKKVAQHTAEKDAWHEKHTSTVDWLELIEEAQTVIENNANQVGVKFKDKATYFYMEQPYKSDPMDAVINIEFTNRVAEVKNAITGPVIIKYPSIKDRMAGTCKTMTMVQKTIWSQPTSSFEFGGCLFLSCYHIGAHENIAETYEKMLGWAKKYDYICDEVCYERYVVDHWTTKNTSEHVAEILIAISK